MKAVSHKCKILQREAGVTRLDFFSYTKYNWKMWWNKMKCAKISFQTKILWRSRVPCWLTYHFKTTCGRYYYPVDINVWFKYHLGQKYHASQVQPGRGLNSWPPDHDSTFHVTEIPALTTWPSVTSYCPLMSKALIKSGCWHATALFSKHQ